MKRVLCLIFIIAFFIGFSGCVQTQSIPHPGYYLGNSASSLYVTKDGYYHLDLPFSDYPGSTGKYTYNSDSKILSLDNGWKLSLTKDSETSAILAVTSPTQYKGLFFTWSDLNQGSSGTSWAIGMIEDYKKGK